MARIPRQGNKVMPPVWGDGSAGPSSSGGAPSGGGSAPQAGGPSPTGWVNVQNYLAANQDQADAMGQNLAGQLETEATRAAGQADKYRADMNAYATAPKEIPNPEYNEWAKTLWRLQNSHAGGNPGVLDAHMSTQPVKTLPAPGVTAPTLPTAPGKALEKINAAGTAAGRAEMFAGKAGPSYNVGQSNLDSYLAGAGAGGQALQGLGQKFGSVLDIVRYPYPGALPPGGRPGSPNDGAQEPGTVPLPVDKKPGDPFLPPVPAPPGSRPGDPRTGAPTTGTNKRKRFA